MTVARGKYMNPRDGDVIEYQIVLDHDRVLIPGFEVRGCDAARRAAYELARLARGKAPEDAARIDPRELIALLSLSPDEERCALTAVAALRAALVDAHITSLAIAEVEKR
jgi:NifU-like protein involved in Fe-S cluster formation